MGWVVGEGDGGLVNGDGLHELGGPLWTCNIGHEGFDLGGGGGVIENEFAFSLGRCCRGCRWR